MTQAHCHDHQTQAIKNIFMIRFLTFIKVKYAYTNHRYVISYYLLFFLSVFKCALFHRCSFYLKKTHTKTVEFSPCH